MKTIGMISTNAPLSNFCAKSGTRTYSIDTKANDIKSFCVIDSFWLSPLTQVLHIHKYLLRNFIIIKDSNNWGYLLSSLWNSVIMLTYHSFEQ